MLLCEFSHRVFTLHAYRVCVLQTQLWRSACKSESLWRHHSLNAVVHWSLLCVNVPPHVCVCAGMCLRTWATRGHSLSTSATCRMTQLMSAWLGRRRASPRFLSKVYESLSSRRGSFSARFNKRCHLSSEKLVSSVPFMCFCCCLFLSAFMPHSSMQHCNVHTPF